MNRSADYDTDILEWSEQQASALRGLARTRPDLSNQLDWENVAEEIECVGRSEFAAVQSFLRQILIHVIKAASVPDSGAILHWRTEVAGFHDDLLDRLTPSMLSRIELAELWTRAAKRAEIDLAAHGQSVSPALPSRCPLALRDIIDPEFDFLKAVEAVRKQITDARPSV
ncbi:MAG: hypothetical protein QOG83_1526 [Alphaproteobacteria bacterium]|nr:hypothetical protein [Alphaproteobacteria bacterium]